MLRTLRKTWITIITAMFIMAAVVVIPAHSATVTSVVDQMGNQDAGTSSNHTLLFTTPSGISEGGTVVLTFDASFDTSSIVEDDVDVEDDGVDLTTASDCSGSEKASVSMAADVLTVTVCAGDGGAISAASEVTVKIGTHATSSGTGANKIVNPSSVGTYSIQLAGTFGDVGNVWVPIISDSYVSVSATVPGGGGGGPGDVFIDPILCGDTTTPIISGVNVSVTSSTATIMWGTNEQTTSVVNYGTTISYGSTEQETSLVYWHKIVLSGLDDGTVYHFEAVSQDLCTNQASSGDFVFTTLDNTAPVISNIMATVSEMSVVITWNTNELATGSVDYGLTDSYGNEIEYFSYITNHSAVITGLTVDTVYHFRITVRDSVGNRTQSSDQVFVTLADLAPSNVSNFTAVQFATLTTSWLQWENPPDADLRGVHIVFRTDRYPTSMSDGTEIFFGNLLGFMHTGLAYWNTYYYAAFAEDYAGHLSSGALASVTLVTSVVEEEEEEEEEHEEELDDDVGEGPEDDHVGEVDDTVGEGDDHVGEGDDVGEDHVGEGGDEVGIGEGGDDVGEDHVGEGGEGGDDVGEAPETHGDVTTVGGGAVCGNGVCEGGESESSCPSDCELEVIAPVSSAGGELVNVDYLVANDRIEIFERAGHVDLLSGRSVTVLANANVPDGAVVQLRVGLSLYLMTETDDGYYANVVTPSRAGAVQASIVSVVGDAEYVLASYILDLRSFGYTFEYVEGGRERIGFTRVTLFVLQGGTFLPWDGAVYGQLNPQVTPQDGTYAWYVPTGSYYVTASADGYRPAQTATMFVANSIVTKEIELRRKPPSILDAIVTPAPPLEKLGAVAGAISGNIVGAVETARENTQVQQGIDVAAPVVLATSVASALVLSFSFNLLPFLHYLITSPVLLLWRRRRKSWGVVYDAITKLPIDLTIVRLYRLTDGRLMQSRVTDKFGRYFFLTDQGKYRIGLAKTGYVFPSEYLKGQRQDAGFLDLYHGEQIEVVEEHATVAANIPLDPISVGARHAPLRIKIKRVLRTTQHIVAFGGLIVAAVILVLRPNVYTSVVCGVQVAAYLLIRRLAVPQRKPKGWGIVYDDVTKKPIRNVVVRIFEPLYDKLLATAVTDKKGRYNFLVGPNEYYARYEKSGYKTTEVKPIDFKDKIEPTDITIDVSLKKSDDK